MRDQMRDWVSNPTKGLRFAAAAAPQALRFVAPSAERTDQASAIATVSVPSPRRNRVELSRIFLWFADDFGGYEGLKEWLTQFLDDPSVTEETLGRAAVRYFEYDWQINRAPPRTAPTPTSASSSVETPTSSGTVVSPHHPTTTASSS
jgi:hypothetical protein